MSSLWPEDIAKERINYPKIILREQASFLSRATGDLVQGRVSVTMVEDEDDDDDSYSRYSFHIVAPSLNNYHYKLITIYHEIEIYPVYILVEDNILNEISGRITVEQVEQHGYRIVAQSEKEFYRVLKNIFSSKKTKKVVTSLLSQTDPEWNKRSF